MQYPFRFAAATATFAVAQLLAGAPALAQHAKGPDPTSSALERAGTFPTRTVDVPGASVSGFGGGRVWYPTTAGSHGVVAVSPGYTAGASTMYFWGERLSSHGFVVIVIETLTVLDPPDSRARQLVAALDHVVAQSAVRGHPLFGRVDGARRAVAGHSMGGSGALLAASNHPGLKATLTMAPWHPSPAAFRQVRVPTLVFACQSDAIAPVSQHAAPFYAALPAATKKSFVEVRGDDHLCVMNGGGHDATLGKLGIAWMKRFVDNDARYGRFLCGVDYNATVGRAEISAKRNNCPY